MPTVTYFTNAAPRSGLFLGRETNGAAIGVLESLTQEIPVGAALPSGWGDDGISLGRLFVRGAALPGRWIVVDRAFRPAY